MTDPLTTRIAVAIHGATPPNPDAALALHRAQAERVAAALGDEESLARRNDMLVDELEHLRAAVRDARGAAERRIRLERDTDASWSPTEAYNDALYIYRSEIDPVLRAALVTAEEPPA